MTAPCLLLGNCFPLLLGGSTATHQPHLLLLVILIQRYAIVISKVRQRCVITSEISDGNTNSNLRQKNADVFDNFVGEVPNWLPIASAPFPLSFQLRCQYYLCGSTATHQTHPDFFVGNRKRLKISSPGWSFATMIPSSDLKGGSIDGAGSIYQLPHIQDYQCFTFLMSSLTTGVRKVKIR